MARFAQYAMVASEEALKDAGWAPKDEEDLEATVRETLQEESNQTKQYRACIWDLALVV